MQLTLTVLRCPDTVAPETRTVTGGEFIVGRGPGVDWVLADPDQVVSRRHFTMAFRAGDWQIADESANGTYANRDAAPIGKGNQRTLRDHDRLRVGPYEIEVTLQDQDADRYHNPHSFAPASQPGFSNIIPGDAFDNPFDEVLGSIDAPPVFNAGFAQQTQQDHSSVLQDAMLPPAPVGHMPASPGGLIPAGNLLADDWDKDLLEGIGIPAALPQTPAPVFAVEPGRVEPARADLAATGSGSVTPGLTMSR